MFTVHVKLCTLRGSEAKGLDLNKVFKIIEVLKESEKNTKVQGNMIYYRLLAVAVPVYA